MLLKEAINANIPLISVKTTDILNIKDYLQDIGGKKVFEYKNGGTVNPDRLYYFYHDKLQLAAPTTVYKEMREQESVLIIVNPIEEHPTYYKAGYIPVSKEVVRDYLCENMSEKDAEKILPSVGGLNLKEVGDVLMITQARDSSLTAAGVIKTRKHYLQKSRGLDMVDTQMPSYLPDKRLEDFAKKQKSFFLNGPDFRLMPRGIIASGAPGTGKSLGAKYLASAWAVPLYRLDSTVQGKYQGESEDNLATALAQIEQEAPCIFLLDEVEKLFSKNGGDNGTTQKMLGMLLWWLQEHRSRVLTFMTCNDITILPPELYRSGRIDEKFVFKGVNKKEALALAKYILDSYNLKKLKVLPTIQARISKKFSGNKSTIPQADVDTIVKKTIKEAYIALKK